MYHWTPPEEILLSSNRLDVLIIPAAIDFPEVRRLYSSGCLTIKKVECYCRMATETATFLTLRQ
jgi:hypothetical protein